MYMHPNLLDRLAQDHQRQLLREAEMERLARQARVAQPSRLMRLMRLRLLASDLLLRMGRRGQPQTVDTREQAGALSHARNRAPVPAHGA